MDLSELPGDEINTALRNIQNGIITLSSLKSFFLKYKVHWSKLCYHKTGDTILHYAARLGLCDTIDFLLSEFHPKAVDCRNRDDKTALHEAAQFGQFETCKQLLEHGADVNALKRADWTPLMLACTKVESQLGREARLKIVNLLLQKGGLPNYRNKDGWTSIHLIAREGDLDIFNSLIKYDCDLTVKTKNGRTVLHIAALHGKIKIVEVILSLNINVNERDNCGNTPLHEAILGNGVLICKKLIQHGAFTDFKNNSDFGLIHLAASEGHLPVLEFLINELKVDINETNKNGITALHCSARKGQKETYNFLVAHNADKNIQDIFGRTAAQYFS